MTKKYRVIVNPSHGTSFLHEVGTPVGSDYGQGALDLSNDLPDMTEEYAVIAARSWSQGYKDAKQGKVF